MSAPSEDDKALHKLYKTYWALILEDACIHTGLAPTKENKVRLHEAHKKIYGIDSLSGRPFEFVSEFMFVIVAYYATDLGIFLRTSGKMPENISELPLSQCWEWL